MLTRRNPRSSRCRSLAVLAALATTAVGTAADAATWDGGAGDSLWSSGNNWDPNGVPANGDALVFSGSTGLTNTNDLASGRSYAGITFSSGAGAFVITGTGGAGSNNNQFDLAGNIAVNSTAVQTLNNRFTLTADRAVDVVTGGSLVLNGRVFGGSGVGITKSGAGSLTLADTTFSGELDVQAGTVLLGNSSTFENASGVILGVGTVLQTTYNGSGKATPLPDGIAVGPNSGSGSATIRIRQPNGNSRTLDLSAALKNNASGTGSLVLQGATSGTSILNYSGTATHTGNTTIGQNLTVNLTSVSSFLLDIDDASNSQFNGLGSLNLNGLLQLDVDGVSGPGVWTLVDPLLTASYGSTFALELDDGSAFSQTADVWTFSEGGNTWTFTEDSGVLTLTAIPEPASLTLLAAGGLLMTTGRRDRN